jgi:glycosyltransferase involved in cell wall biosynthesis
MSSALLPAARELRRLVIVSHVTHYRANGALYAYGPYAREIDIWADLFPEVEIAAPCRRADPPADALRFTRDNIRIRPQIEAGGDTWAAKASQVVQLPLMIAQLAWVLRGADAVHVRCPGNLGLLGAVLAPAFGCPRIAKYAGQWNGYAGEPRAVRWQRRVLASRWWNAPVTVYGEWPDQPPHVVPFFTSMMSQQQVAHATSVAATKRLDGTLRVLFVGALARRKRVDALVEGAAIAASRGVDLELTIVGEGPEHDALAALVRERGLAGITRFTGGLPFDEALRWYEWANCLVLPSKHSEGWPKAVAEAMSFGVIGIAVDHGQLRSMLDSRGVLLPNGTPAEIADALCAIQQQPGAFQQIAKEGARWAGRYSLEGLRDALRQLLQTRWAN